MGRWGRGVGRLDGGGAQGCLKAPWAERGWREVHLFGIDLALLSVLIYLIGGRSADFEVQHLFFVLLGIGIGGVAIIHFLVPVFGPEAVLLIVPFAIFVIVRYVGLSLRQIVLVAVLFIAVRSTISLAGWLLLR